MAQQIVTLSIINDKIQQSVCTLTGTSGTANIAVAGTNYLATFDTTLTETAEDFVDTHAATILSAKSIVVTSVGAKLVFKALTQGAYFTLTSTNASGNLDGTEALGLIDETVDMGSDSIVTIEDLTDSRRVCVEGPRLIKKNLTVLNTYATLMTDADGSMIEVTVTETGDAIGLNANRIQALLPEGTGTKILYSDGGASVKPLIVDESPSDIESLVDGL